MNALTGKEQAMAPRKRWVRFVAIAFATAMTVACSSTSRTTANASSAGSALSSTTTTSPPVASTTVTSAPSPASNTPVDLSSLRYDSAVGHCPNAPFAYDGQVWQTTAPRAPDDPPVGLGQAVTVGLRQKSGTVTVPVTATVTTPEGTTAMASGVANADSFLDLSYPAMFTGAGTKPSSPGDFTVIWTAAGGFVACDGWTEQAAD